MKNYIATILIVTYLLNNFSAIAQRNNDKYATRYRLDISKEWIKKPRLMRAITNILPQTLFQIKDFDFCTEGKSAYTVKLFISRPMVQNEFTSNPIEYGGITTYTHSFSYNFYAALVLYDTSGTALTMLRVNDFSEQYEYRKEYTKSSNINSPTLIQSSNTDNHNHAVSQELMTQTFNSPVLQQRNKAPKTTLQSAKAILCNDFLLKLCELKIFEIQKILRQVTSLQ